MAKENGKQMQTGRPTIDELRSAKHKLLESAESGVEKSPNYKQLVLTLGLVKQEGLIHCTGRLGMGVQIWRNQPRNLFCFQKITG